MQSDPEAKNIVFSTPGVPKAPESPCRILLTFDENTSEFLGISSPLDFPFAASPLTNRGVNYTKKVAQLDNTNLFEREYPMTVTCLNNTGFGYIEGRGWESWVGFVKKKGGVICDSIPFTPSKNRLRCSFVTYKQKQYVFERACTVYFVFRLCMPDNCRRSVN